VKVVTRPVYYCEHCKRHRLTRSAIERHEPRCIYNPDRSVCGWHKGAPVAVRPADLVAAFRESLDLEPLRRAFDGCPACVLSVVVQADLSTAEREDCGFDYREEIERFRRDEVRVEW
jgi:hypothetical protein